MVVSSLHAPSSPEPLSAVFPPSRAAECCVVVADGGAARVFSARRGAGSPACLVQHADVTASDTLTRDRDFADAIIAEVCDVVAVKGSSKVVLVAPARALGLLREPLQHALKGRVAVMALARDYSDLTPEQVAEVLDLS